MKDFKIKKYDYFADHQKITDWQDESNNTQGYKQIKKFIVSDFDEAYDLDSFLIELEEDEVPFYKDRFKFIAETSDGEAIGFLSIIRPREQIRMGGTYYIEFLMVNPKYQGQGYGSAILAEMFSNVKKYTWSRPDIVTTMFKRRNESSKRLFEKFGFLIKKQPLSFYCEAGIKMDTLEKNIEQLKQAELPQPE